MRALGRSWPRDRSRHRPHPDTRDSRRRGPAARRTVAEALTASLETIHVAAQSAIGALAAAEVSEPPKPATQAQGPAAVPAGAVAPVSAPAPAPAPASAPAAPPRHPRCPRRYRHLQPSGGGRLPGEARARKTATASPRSSPTAGAMATAGIDRCSSGRGVADLCRRCGRRTRNRRKQMIDLRHIGRGADV